MTPVELAEIEWNKPHQPKWYASNGLGWASADLWCGAFVAYCWKSIHPRLRKDLFASTYRLWLYGQYQADSNLWKPTMANGINIRYYNQTHGGLRLFAKDFRCAIPGDICIVGQGKYGSHITLVVNRTDAGLETISGNGLGIRINGSLGPGVVKNLYKPEQVRFIIRPSVADLDCTVVYS